MDNKTEYNLTGKNDNNQQAQLDEVPTGERTQETEQLEQQQSEPENPTTTAESSQIGNEEPDWDNIKVEEPEAAERPNNTAGKMAEEVETPEGNKFLLGYDFFHTGFCKAMKISGHILKLETLKTAPEQETCPHATRCLYDIVLDTPALHFLLHPDSIWLQRAFMLGSFFVPLFGGCAKEMKARRPKDGKKKGWFS